jgi:beta-phosphoglucomutase-like phosphatase (HAD superfamily)
MILQAATDLGLDLGRCVLIGDNMSDIRAGATAGIGLRILIGRHQRSGDDAPSHRSAADLPAALALLRDHFGGQS